MAVQTEKQKIGALGEEIASKFLTNKGFTIKLRNYRKKCGEIDIIAEKGEILHFIEVKSVSRESSNDFDPGVSHETCGYRPEDNIHPQKLKRLSRAISLYLWENFHENEPKWVFDAITVKLNIKTTRAFVKFIGDITL